MPCMRNSVIIRKTRTCHAELDSMHWSEPTVLDALLAHQLLLLRSQKPKRQAHQCQFLTGLLKPCLMLIHPNCHLVLVSHQAIQRPKCQPKQIRNLMKSFFEIEEKYRRMYINHQVLIPSFYTHVMKTRPLVEFVMK